MTFFTFMLKIMTYILALAQILKHLPRRNQMIRRSGRNCKDGVFEARGFRTLAEDFLFNNAGLGHDVQGKGNGALSIL